MSMAIGSFASNRARTSPAWFAQAHRQHGEVIERQPADRT
jgi:hypothetical protein